MILWKSKIVYLLHFVFNLNMFGSVSTISLKEEILEKQFEEKDFQFLLAEIMIKSLQSYKCVTIIVDEWYMNIFEKSWFRTFGGLISFLMITVEESEDLLSPYNETQNSLTMAKNNGCQMYIILISNGFQVARFLRFGDRFRALDIRSKYIILFDSRLFAKKMFYIWKRLINVVFIKKFESKRNKNGELRAPWYELTTVPFPSPIMNVLVTRRLDIWTNMKFRKGTDLFRDKTTDLKNQTLYAAAFAHIPGTIKKKSYQNESSYENMFAGAEIEILKTVSNAMNFHYRVYEPVNADEELWGAKQKGRIYSGLIGEMVSTKADIALGDLYYIPAILELMDLSIPYNTECLTFLTPESLTDNSWKTLILPFKLVMWAGVIVCLLISGMVFYILARFHLNITEIKKELRKNYKNKTNELYNKKNRDIVVSMQYNFNNSNKDLKYTQMKERYQQKKDENDPVGLFQFSEPVNSILYTYSMLLLVSLPKLPTGWSLRVLTGWYWLYCLLVVVAYRASMTAILSRPTPRVTIDTLQDLIKSKITYGGWGEVNRQFFQTSTDPAIRSIGLKFETVNNSEEAVDKVAEGTFAFYENTYFLKDALVKRQNRYQQQYIANNGNQSDNDIANAVKSDRSLHIMGDCIINMPVSIGLQKNSPIKPRVDQFIRRVLEAGLIKKWIDDVMQNVLNNEVQDDTENTKALMNIRKFSGALFALFIGYFISFICFTFELIHFQYIVKRNPNFNKYSRTIIIKK